MSSNRNGELITDEETQPIPEPKEYLVDITGTIKDDAPRTYRAIYSSDRVAVVVLHYLKSDAVFDLTKPLTVVIKPLINEDITP
jgi:hypothetical protein